MSDNMTINRLRFGFHRSDNRFQNSVPVLALLCRHLVVSGYAPVTKSYQLLNNNITIHYTVCIVTVPNKISYNI